MDNLEFEFEYRHRLYRKQLFSMTSLEVENMDDSQSWQTAAIFQTLLNNLNFQQRSKTYQPHFIYFSDDRQRCRSGTGSNVSDRQYVTCQSCVRRTPDMCQTVTQVSDSQSSIRLHTIIVMSGDRQSCTVSDSQSGVSQTISHCQTIGQVQSVSQIIT